MADSGKFHLSPLVSSACWVVSKARFKLSTPNDWMTFLGTSLAGIALGLVFWFNHYPILGVGLIALVSAFNVITAAYIWFLREALKKLVVKSFCREISRRDYLLPSLIVACNTENISPWIEEHCPEVNFGWLCVDVSREYSRHR